MSTLTLHFQTGFEGDDVEVQVNGRPVVTRPKLKTSLLTGFAGSVATEVEGEHATVEVTVPRLHLHQSIAMDMRGSVHLGVSIEGSQLALIPSKQAFGYA